MNTTLHPLDERCVSVNARLAAYMSDDGASSPAGKAGSRCPVCDGALEQAGEDGEPHRLVHRFREDATRCPLTTPSYQPDGIGVHQQRDVRLLAAHRDIFLRHWSLHFQVMRRAVPALTIQRFVHLIEYADVLNLWSYPELDERDVPYVLLVMAGFIRQVPQPAGDEDDAEGEVTWVRFWFDSSVSDEGDLWLQGRARPQLFRLIYRDPELTPFPTGAEVLQWETVVRDEAFLDNPVASVASVSRADMQAFHRFMGMSPGRDGRLMDGRGAAWF
ncbi:hypothetical protein [Paraburkholderia sp. BCC1885]|uniref:hypothetical protein n=1 Tax=Paraburkholderia sp. BCC1885 TaxID=2562669 RepID=UPI0011835BF6|nr:hypothetical protein [Paraburkholderia sp. BCC1885]